MKAKLERVGTIRGKANVRFGDREYGREVWERGRANSRFLTESSTRFGMTRWGGGDGHAVGQAPWSWMSAIGAGWAWPRGCKERGEWAELIFMARCAGLGLGVMKPFGDSRRYDVAVEAGRMILRVQVRSTIYKRRGREYSLNMMGPGRKRYKPGSVDFFAVYLIPENQWYIIPYAALGKKMTLHITPGGGRQKYGAYLEAWELLGAVVRGGQKAGSSAALRFASE